MPLTVIKIYNKIAKEQDVSFEEVKSIVESQFKTVRRVMKEGTKNEPDSFKVIQLTHLGKFLVRKHHILKMKEIGKQTKRDYDKGGSKEV